MAKRNLQIIINVPFSCDCDHKQEEWDHLACSWEADIDRLGGFIANASSLSIEVTETPPKRIVPKKEIV